MKLIEKIFEPEEKATFPYWFYHWWNFNAYSINKGVWKPKYLLHDFEKPWMKLVMGYEKLKHYHRINSNHHLEYKNPEKIDYEAIIIDWEVARFTKKDALNAIETLDYELEKRVEMDLDKMITAMKKVIPDFIVCREKEKDSRVFEVIEYKNGKMIRDEVKSGFPITASLIKNKLIMRKLKK